MEQQDRHWLAIPKVRVRVRIRVSRVRFKVRVRVSGPSGLQSQGQLSQRDRATLDVSRDPVHCSGLTMGQVL